MQEFKHKPVLLDECLSGLNIRPDGVYVDGTLGGGGHSSEIAKRLTTGTLIGIDRDMDAIRAATARVREATPPGARFEPRRPPHGHVDGGLGAALRRADNDRKRRVCSQELPRLLRRP